MKTTPFTAIAAASLFAGCAGPSIKLQTDEPLQVDINMRVDVFQHGAAPGGVGSKAAGAKSDTKAAESTPESRRRNRMADIQTFKDSRLVGEGRDGLLVVISEPPGDYGQYVQKTVAEENADRIAVMKALAESSKRSLKDVQAERAEDWRIRSFRGEWIEVPTNTNGGYEWKQKEG